MAQQHNLAHDLREAAKLPVSALASLLGISRQAYYKWLHGGTITPEHLTKLREMLYMYQMKGWLRKVEPLAWGLSHRTYEEMKDDLDQLSPCCLERCGTIEDNSEEEAYWAGGFLFK